MLIRVQDQTGKIFSGEFSQDQNIYLLKMRLVDEKFVDPNIQFALFLNDRELTDDQTFNVLPITQDSTIMLAFPPKSNSQISESRHENAMNEENDARVRENVNRPLDRLIMDLTDLGFPKDACIDALNQTNFQPEYALNILFHENANNFYNYNNDDDDGIIMDENGNPNFDSLDFDDNEKEIIAGLAKTYRISMVHAVQAFEKSEKNVEMAKQLIEVLLKR
ncbi:hypothetical protein TRFO_01149 [Tritrichomonas foetus]|uniref:UBA domain-containing protein n=1 Tax=Tritrichomonas foetus TaxID=1144522 RepID=A0A1J4KIK8_9EUKA|nr:hypothetical protein TRFO_01149 [Tritrichomonas foetus]|eukprot:OHT11209.1 hypothetical protein TRFO_01149 [Tritrichomonas foetus]